MPSSCGGARASRRFRRAFCEATPGLWKCRAGGKCGKPKNRFPTLPTGPWKSRPPREIPTFPQPRRAPDEKVENQTQVSHFSTRRTRRRQPDLSLQNQTQERKSAAARPPHPCQLLCVIKFFHDHSWIGKCYPVGGGKAMKLMTLAAMAVLAAANLSAKDAKAFAHTVQICVDGTTELWTFSRAQTVAAKMFAE